MRGLGGNFISLLLLRARRDLSTIGDTVLIAVTKDGVRFSTTGDIGSANVTIRHLSPGYDLVL